MYHVYVLKSQSSSKIYIGSTNNLERRVIEHNSFRQNIAHFTRKNAGPWTIVYKEKLNDKRSALKREKELKSFRGREFIKNIISINRP